MPKWEERIKAVRGRLGLTQEELAYLLNVSPSAITGWETGRSGPRDCWEKVISYLESDPEEAAGLIGEAIQRKSDLSWPARFSALQDKIGLTNKWLSEILDVSLAPVVTWKSGTLAPSGCHELIFRILEMYADSDRESWPKIIRVPQKDVLSPERIKTLRLGLMMRQLDLANVLHITAPQVSCWEHGVQEPGWCANLFLRLLEAMPGPTLDLLERIPWGPGLSAEEAVRIRESAGLTQADLSQLVRADIASITRHDKFGATIRGCDALIYRLLDRYRDEFVSLVGEVVSA